MRIFFKIGCAITILSAVLSGCGGGGGAPDTSSPPPTNQSGIATVSWNPVTTYVDNTNCVIGGYRVYYSLGSPVTRTNSTILDAGNNTTADVGNLTNGQTYYFRVSAYDTSGVEGDLSQEEVSKSII
jgi:hypothetical protein